MNEHDIEQRIIQGKPEHEPSRAWFRANLRQQLVATHKAQNLGASYAPRNVFDLRYVFMGVTAMAGVFLAIFLQMYRSPASFPVAVQTITDVDTFGDLSEAVVSRDGFGGSVPEPVSERNVYVFPDELPEAPRSGYVYRIPTPPSVENFPKTAPLGYDIDLDARYGMWELRPNEAFVPVSEEEGYFLKEDLPSKEALLAVADTFTESLGITSFLSHFAPPEVLFNTVLDEFGEEKEFYIAWVRYPLRIQGAMVDDPFSFGPIGATVGINMHSLQVINVSLPPITTLERAEYSLITDPEFVRERLSAINYGDVVSRAEVSPGANFLGVPEVVLARFNVPGGYDIYGPAWRFAVLGERSFADPEYLYVPLFGDNGL